ncbi:alpha/beta fold hydrolase [Enhygromyxa salina]|uniref:Proline iminopeptidase n=1 Tax=Enhygromyxa salina TaxID=215803 RepID=A0A2S9YSY8_9BACT|nr:alpha/beta hydrolase [Enhygromyxa salina]PRQ08152.1 Proline iminopeptidase [Enhygromyxa salina]
MHAVLRGSLLSGLAAAAWLGPGCTSATDPHLVPATVVDDPTLPRLALADGRLVHLQTFGDPSWPLVIVLHGGPGGDHRDYLHLASLADEYFVVLWDQRGTGLSERVPDSEIDGPTYLDDLAFLGEHFSPDRPFHLIGHSWGGAYATYFVQHHPDRVDKLVLAEPGALDTNAAAVGNDAGVDFVSHSVQEYLNTSDYLLPDTDARADYFYVIALASFKPDERLLGYEFWRLGLRVNVGINEWQGNFGGPNTFDFTTGLADFDRKVLLIAGTSDGRLGYEFQRTHHAIHFPDVELLHLPDATHSELLRRPESLEAIRRYLAEPPAAHSETADEWRMQAGEKSRPSWEQSRPSWRCSRAARSASASRSGSASGCASRGGSPTPSRPTPPTSSPTRSGSRSASSCDAPVF